MREAKYEVIGTVTKGKQNTIYRKDAEGNTFEVKHKKPVGYVLKDLQTGKNKIMTHTETVAEVVMHGATNVMVTVTYKTDGTVSPYIRAKTGETSLQDKDMIVEMKDVLNIYGKAYVTNKMSKVIHEITRFDRKEILERAVELLKIE